MQFKRPGSVSTSPGFLQTIAGRRLIRQAAVVAGAFLVGYLVTVLWLFPAPIFRKEHAVPRVLDLGATEAREKLEAQGLRFRVEDQQTDPSVPAGSVVWQDPPPASVIPPNTQVSVILSEGPPNVAVPDVAGFPRALAEKVLKAAGFTAGRRDTLPAASEAGIVVQTRPAAGIGRPAGSAVDLVISLGPAELTVPTVVGLGFTQARQRLEATGLAVGATVGRVVEGRADGIVLDQRPTGGSRVPRGFHVDLVVTKKAP
jgi:serine/threonine-protein kinase